MKMTPLQLAIKSVGSQKALADALKISPPSLNAWVKRDRVPAERVLAVEALTGVSRHLLRPDIYGTVQAARKRAAA